MHLWRCGSLVLGLVLIAWLVLLVSVSSLVVSAPLPQAPPPSAPKALTSGTRPERSAQCDVAQRYAARHAELLAAATAEGASVRYLRFTPVGNQEGLGSWLMASAALMHIALAVDAVLLIDAPPLARIFAPRLIDWSANTSAPVVGRVQWRQVYSADEFLRAIGELRDMYRDGGGIAEADDARDLLRVLPTGEEHALGCTLNALFRPLAPLPPLNATALHLRMGSAGRPTPGWLEAASRARWPPDSRPGSRRRRVKSAPAPQTSFVHDPTFTRFRSLDRIVRCAAKASPVRVFSDSVHGREFVARQLPGATASERTPQHTFFNTTDEAFADTAADMLDMARCRHVLLGAHSVTEYSGLSLVAAAFGFDRPDHSFTCHNIGRG